MTILQLQFKLMGQQLGRDEPSLAVVAQLESRFSILQHPHYSHAPHLKLLNERTTNAKYILRILATNNQQEERRVEELIACKITNKSKYVTRLEQYFTEHEKSYCGSQTKAYLLFNVHHAATPLDSPFPPRAHPNKEPLLLHALAHLTRALLELMALQTPHGNICTHTVYVVGEQLVLSDPWIAPEGVDLPGRFPSPEKLMKVNNQIEDYDPYASDLFSIAMTVLEMAKQDKLDRIYKKNHSLNMEALMQEIQRCPYAALRETLRYLLLSSENNRRQYLYDSRVKYQLMDEQMRSEERGRGIRRINLISNKDNLIVNKDTSMHKRNRPADFSKEHKVHTAATLPQQPTLVHLPNSNVHVPQRINPRMTPSINDPHRPKSLSRVNFNYTPNLTINHPKYEPPLPPLPQPIHIQHDFPKFSLAPDKSTPNTRHITPKFTLDYQNNVIKVDDKAINNLTSIHDNFQYTNQIPKQSNLPANDTTELHAPTKVETPLAHNKPSEGHSNSSQFNDYMACIDQSINKFEMEVSKAIQQTIREMQVREKESAGTVQDRRSPNTYIAQSQVTTQSQVHLPELHQPPPANTAELANSIVLQANNESLQKQSQNVDEVLNSYGREEGGEGRNTLLIHGTQLQSVSNLAIPEEASSQEQSFDSTLEDKGVYCEEYFQNGGVYKGYMRGGQRSGEGVFYYKDGGYYEGQWRGNKMSGFGRLYYECGKLAYEGQWFKDEFHGRGKIYNDSPQLLRGGFDFRNFQNQDLYWKYYEGDLSFDSKEGHGKLVLSNEEYYVGEFREDRPCGKGHFYGLQRTVHGIWKRGILLREL